MDLRIGLLTFSSKTGLAYQGQAFARHMQPTKILISDLSNLNRMPVDHSWANNARTTEWPSNDDYEWLTDEVDLVFICETPLNFALYEIAQRKGVKVINQYNYEFADIFMHPDWPEPTVYAAPTIWNKDKIAELTSKPIIDLPVPVDRELFPFRHRTKLKSFIHVIGRPTYEDRNGTLIFLEAIRHYKGKADFKIFYQPPSDPKAISHFAPVLDQIERYKKMFPIEIHTDVDKPVDIYNRGDVLVLPRRYGGLCLPMQEALSSGLPVIMTDLEPNNNILPKEWLINSTLLTNFMFHAPVDVYDANPIDLAEKMFSFEDSTFLSDASLIADHIANNISWSTLKNEYDTKLETICE